MTNSSGHTPPPNAFRDAYALQDFFAHGNKGIPGIDPNYGFRDSFFSAVFGASGHMSGTGGNLDNPNYGWTDLRTELFQPAKFQ